MTDEPEEEPVDDDDASEDEVPRVILAKLSAIASYVPEHVAKAYGDRPIWFLLGMDAELVTLFERIPEDPMPKGRVEAILGGLRAFAKERNDELQAALGVTDSLEFGFHVDAPFDRVVESFELDGFDVAGTIVAGQIELLAEE